MLFACGAKAADEWNGMCGELRVLADVVNILDWGTRPRLMIAFVVNQRRRSCFDLLTLTIALNDVLSTVVPFGHLAVCGRRAEDVLPG